MLLLDQNMDQRGPLRGDHSRSVVASTVHPSLESLQAMTSMARPLVKRWDTQFRAQGGRQPACRRRGRVFQSGKSRSGHGVEERVKKIYMCLHLYLEGSIALSGFNLLYHGQTAKIQRGVRELRRPSRVQLGLQR